MLLGPKHTNCPSFVVGDYSSVHTATRAFTRAQRVRLSQSDILEAVYAILLDAEHSNGDYVEFVHRTNLRYFSRLLNLSFSSYTLLFFSTSPSPPTLVSSSHSLSLELWQPQSSLSPFLPSLLIWLPFPLQSLS